MKIAPVLFALFMAATVGLQAQDDSSLALGTWEWKFENPEQGHMEGTFTIKKGESGHEMVITGPDGEMPVQDVEIEDNKLTKGWINYEGYRVNFKGTFDEEDFTGNLIVDYEEMPFNAKRKQS